MHELEGINKPKQNICNRDKEVEKALGIVRAGKLVTKEEQEDMDNMVGDFISKNKIKHYDSRGNVIND